MKTVENVLKKDFPEHSYTKMQTAGCTYKIYDENSILQRYVKFLNDRQYDYYITHASTIIPYHAPYSMDHGGKYLAMVPFGAPIDGDVEEEGIAWALKAVKQMNDAGVYHGDVINSTEAWQTGYFINTGNILVDAVGEFKLIDFGPLDEDERTDEAIIEKERENWTAYNKPRPPSVRKQRKRRKREEDVGTGDLSDSFDEFGMVDPDADEEDARYTPPGLQRSKLKKTQLYFGE